MFATIDEQHRLYIPNNLLLLHGKSATGIVYVMSMPNILPEKMPRKLQTNFTPSP